MELAAVADFIAVHALMILLLVTLFMVLLTAALWRVIERAGPQMLERVVLGWNALRQRPLATRWRSAPLVGGALTRTLSVGRYLGIHALLSFALALVAVSAFVALAEEIGIDEELAKFDQALSSALSQHLSDRMLEAFAILTHLGDAHVLLVLAAGVALVLFWRRQYLLAWAWIVTTAGGGLLTRLLKAYFARTRPIHDHGFASADGWSFPSGHAAGSMLVYGLLGYLIVRHTRPVWHIPVVIVTMILIVFIGSSRVLLQVHYFSDVLAGWASAAAWLALCIAGLEAVRRRGVAVAPTLRASA